MYYAGIDLLKIFAMFLITMLHIMGHGGVLEASSGGAYAVSWLIEIICYCGVNCYALISGFLGYTGKHRHSKWIYRWFQVVFCCLCMTTVFYVFESISVLEFIKAVFPITFNQYWYFTAYTGVFLLIPLLNHIVKINSKSNLLKSALVILGISCYATVARRYSDPFELNYGYSFIWLAILYFLGAVIRKYNIHLKYNKKKIFLGVIFLVLFTWIWKVWIGRILGHNLDMLFVSYLSPTILGIALGLLICFAGIKLKKGKWVSVIAPATFGIYLFHVEPLFVRYFLTDKFAFIGKMSPFLIFPTVIGIAFCIFAVGVLTDKIRVIIFTILKIDIISKKIEQLLGIVNIYATRLLNTEASNFL